MPLRLPLSSESAGLMHSQALLSSRRLHLQVESGRKQAEFNWLNPYKRAVNMYLPENRSYNQVKRVWVNIRFVLKFTN